MFRLVRSFVGSYESFERNLLFWNGASHIVAQWRFAQWHLPSGVSPSGMSHVEAQLSAPLLVEVDHMKK